MSNKTTTDTSNQYNSAAMGNYNSFQGTLASGLNQYAQNPLSSSFFNQQYGAAKNQASQVGQRNISNTLANARTGGGILGNSGAFMQNQLNRTSLGNSALQTGAFQSSLNSALQNRQWALSSMQGYQPLQTGQNTTQTQQQGWGSIAGQLAGVAGGMALDAFTGGAGAALSPAAGGMSGGMGGWNTGGGYTPTNY